ncbi:MAG: hypothetical protein EBR82_41395 [Caulobacteraceae bacterium]|nr:hypothetical protein [Caulobacteraceae bacterium]NBX71306.1 hypothetical protein [bacterium]
MIEEDFYCTLKLKSGEEVFAKVAASEEEERTFLIVSNPIVISEYKSRSGESGYKIEPWLKTTTEDMFIIKLDDVLTLSESYDIEMIAMYQSYLRQSYKRKNNESNINRQMGYLSSVNDAKDILEKLYESS